MNNIHREPLGNGMEIYVSHSYRFSTDTLLLAAFSQPAGAKHCADLGAGCGAIPLIWLKNNPALTVAAVVCITLALTVVTAKLVGCTLPILEEKIHLDPAVMAAPFITTILDALSLLIYFALSSAILNL